MSRYIEIVTGKERRAALLLLAVLLIGLPVANASAQPVDAQALCFDIISPRDAARTRRLHSPGPVYRADVVVEPEWKTRRYGWLSLDNACR